MHVVVDCGKLQDAQVQYDSIVETNMENLQEELN